MNRMVTNIGPYEIERRSRVSRLRRVVQAALHVLGAAVAVVLAGLFLFPVNAHAGLSCEQASVNAAAIEQGNQLAGRTAQSLDAGGARVVLLPRRAGMRPAGSGAPPLVLKL